MVSGLLSLMPRTGIHDFTNGNSWGHALHADTWTVEKPRATGFLWWRRYHPRFSVIVHVSPDPLVGERVRYRANGGDLTKVIVEVEGVWNVEDMFTLTLEYEEPIRMTKKEIARALSERG